MSLIYNTKFIRPNPFTNRHINDIGERTEYDPYADYHYEDCLLHGSNIGKETNVNAGLMIVNAKK